MKLNRLLRARKVIDEHANEPITAMLAYKMLKFMKACGCRARRLGEVSIFRPIIGDFLQNIKALFKIRTAPFSFFAIW